VSDEYEEVEMADEEPITRHLEPWNIIGIAATGIGGLFGVMSQAMNMVATECWIHARWVGEQRELRRCQLPEVPGGQPLLRRGQHRDRHLPTRTPVRPPRVHPTSLIMRLFADTPGGCASTLMINRG